MTVFVHGGEKDLGYFSGTMLISRRGDLTC